MPEKLKQEKEQNIANTWSTRENIPINLIPISEEQKEISAQDKITEIKNKNQYFYYHRVGEYRFIATVENNKILLQVNETIIGAFDKVDKTKIRIEAVFNHQKIFYIQVDDNKYLYFSDYNTLQKLNLHIPIEYIKYSEKDLIIVTQKGSFIYDILSKKMEYFSYFHDFIFLENNKWYLWIIKKDDSLRMKNLDLDWWKNDILYYYNFQTKEKQIVQQSNNFDAIYKQDWVIILRSGEQNFKLENF